MASADARAFWVAAPGEGEIRAEALPDPKADEVLVRALFSGISRGTETLVFQGRVPPGERQRMRAPFQAGEFPGPVKYGYASVGEVERGPEALVGRRVFTLHPHQTAYVVPAAAVVPVPDAVPPARAVLAANLETAVNGLWDAAPRVGDHVVVVGGGVVGCLVAWLAGRVPGCRVDLVDINPRREPVASALGVRFVRPPAAPSGADLVVHASGSPEGLVTAIGCAGFEATILEMSWYGTATVPLPLGERFHSQRLTIRSSQVGSVGAGRRARWTARRRLELAVALLADPVLDVLITGESRFDALPGVISALARGERDDLCHRIRYAEA